MKKILIIFVLFLFPILISFNSYGDLFDKTVCVETDAQIRNGIFYLSNEAESFTGKNLCEYEDNQIQSKGEVKDGKKDGKWTYWHENGQIRLEGNYRDSRLDGKWTYWYENGQIRLETKYKEGQKNGKFTTW